MTSEISRQVEYYYTIANRVTFRFRHLGERVHEIVNRRLHLAGERANAGAGRLTSWRRTVRVRDDGSARRAHQNAHNCTVESGCHVSARLPNFSSP